MSIFNDVELTYNGDAYTVKADKVMKLIAVIEDHISLAEISRDQGPPFSKLAMAYGAALRYAGCKVGDDAIYKALFSEEGGKMAGEAVTGLLMMMLPPSTYQPDQKPKKAKASRKK